MSPKSRGRKTKSGKRVSRPKRPTSPARSAGRPGGDARAFPPARRRTAEDERELQTAMLAATDALYTAAEAFRPLLAPDSDPFEAELLADRLIELYTRSAPGGALDLAMGLVPLAVRYQEPQVAALVCAVDHFMSGMGSAMALRDLATAGVPDPPWRESLDAVTPARAWRYQDVFAERQVLVVAFRRPDSGGEHAILLETLPAPHPAIVRMDVARTPGELRDRLAEQAPDLAAEEITLEAAGALAWQVERAHPEVDRSSLTHRSLMRDRVERLPRPEAERTPSASVDRQATVEAFLAATPVPPATDPEALRFWAEALAGHTAVTDDPPARIGPVRLGIILGEYVPRTFAMNPQRRAGLRESVTAWSVWAAREQGLPASAVERLIARVEELAETFEATYDDPDLAPVRCYLSDVAETVSDGRELERVNAVRSHAVPTPDQRPEDAKALLASDPDQRRRILAAELDSWAAEAWDRAPELSMAERLDILVALAEELWAGQPPDLARMIADYAAETGFDDELLGDLFELAVDYRDDRPGLLAQVEDRLSLDDF